MLSTKKAFFLLCFAVVISLFMILLWPVQKLSFSDIPIASEQAVANILHSRTKVPLSFLSVDACDRPLPNDSKTSTWYAPALTEEITINLPFTWQAVRTPTSEFSSDGDLCTILLYNANTYIVYHLVETGLPLISVNLSRFDLPEAFVPYDPLEAKMQLLSVAEDGSLQWQTEDIKIKQRGNSSAIYPKHSYTLFFYNEFSTTSSVSVLGLPSSRKMALNSLYEDDSRIRDALSYQLWEQIEPHNALNFEYIELVLDSVYCGLYGLHDLPTETTLPYEEGDVIYKMNSYLLQDPSIYCGNTLPEYEICAGDPLYSAPLDAFMQQFVAGVSSYPHVLDKENFINNAVFKEVIASEDNHLQNMLVTFHAKEGNYSLTPWDLDQSFGTIFDASSATLVANHFSQTEARHLAAVSYQIRPLSILYNTHPDFADAVANRYRELRQTIFADEVLLAQANELYDQLTDCGARQRDAERWPDSAISEDNSFIEAFIPARMAFLDEVFVSID